MFIENVLKLSGIVFKKQEDLKEPKYKKLKIWNTGWETIDIGSPPTGQAVVNEVKKIQQEIENCTDEQKEQYINCDEDASYYIKQYMDDHDLEYEEDHIELIEDQCRPIIRHYKNFYNRPRPYQVADALGMKLDKFSWDWFGSARTVTVSKETTTIVDGEGDDDAIIDRADDLQKQIDKSTTPYEKENYNFGWSWFYWISFNKVYG